MTFNPDTDIPQTDEQAEAAIKFGKHALVSASAVGIYRCRRGQGESVLRAYEVTLRAMINPLETLPIEKEQPK